jgi:hypothetical protein
MRSCPRLLPLAAAFFVAAAAAQSPVPQAYGSPLADYQPFSEEEVISWREANDRVGRIGGWRAYARESQPPGTAPPAATGTAPARPAVAPAAPSATPAAPAAPAPSGGHQHH